MSNPMNTTPKCPYCGAEMVLRDWQDVFFGKGNFYECCCGAKSPIKASPNTALSAALQRYVEPNRVLTAEEVRRAWKRDVDRLALVPMWYEARGGYVNNWIMMHKYATEENNMTSYGINWRCWLRRPTDEERQSVAWEE